jgi:hypothetical protein
MWVQLRALLRDRDVDPDAAIVADMIPDGPEVIDSVVDVLQRLLDLAQPVEQPGFRLGVEVVCAYYVVDELLGLASDICDLVVRDDGLTRVLPEQDLGGPEALPARVGHRVHELEHGHLAQGAEAHDDVLDLIE